MYEDMLDLQGIKNFILDQFAETIQPRYPFFLGNDVLIKKL